MSNNDGQRAELEAQRYLEKHGLILIEKNWRTRFGEIDLIFKDTAMIVCVEVRMRSRREFGGAAESIDFRKQRRLLSAASLYSIRHPKMPLRLDAVLIDGLDPPKIHWIRDAIRE